MIRDIYPSTIYVKVYPNKFELKNIDTGKFTSVIAKEPFTTTRLLIGQFNSAEEALKEGMVEVSKYKLFNPSPLVVMHQLSIFEGGLSQVEERVLIELALSVGARKAKAWIGHALSDDEVIEYAKSV